MIDVRESSEIDPRHDHVVALFHRAIGRARTLVRVVQPSATSRPKTYHSGWRVHSVALNSQII